MPSSSKANQGSPMCKQEAKAAEETHQARDAEEKISLSFTPTSSTVGAMNGESHAAFVGEAPTPVMSNCAIVTTLPAHGMPILELPPPSASSSEDMTTRIARFSSSSAAPIVMTRVLQTQDDEISHGSLHKPSRPRRRQRAMSLVPVATSRLSTNPLLTTADDDWKFVDAATGLAINSSVRLLDVILRRLVYALFARPMRPTMLWRRLPSAAPTRGKSFDCATAAATTSTVTNHGVCGLPNVGNSCYLNATLQALASLQPFQAYLERVLERRRIHMDDDEDDMGVALLPMTDLVSEQLLRLLLELNGYTERGGGGRSSRRDRGRRGLDPRPLLKAVGRQHHQFNTRGEQQDAEELWQALVGMIVDEAQLDQQYAASTNSFGSPRSVLDDFMVYNDDVLTVVSAGVRQQQQRGASPSPAPQIVGMTIDASAVVPSSASCSSNNNRLVLGQGAGMLFRALPAQPAQHAHHNGHVAHLSDLEEDEMVCQGVLFKRIHARSVPLEQHGESAAEKSGGGSPQYSPPDTSPIMQSSQRKHGSGSSEDNDTASHSTLGRENGSVAMDMMYTTTSSITPSPFCGWLGSSLQCRKCKHAKPIQSAPFFDIAVVPTAVSQAMIGASSLPLRRGARGGPPSKNAVMAAPKECRLEDCLDEFTSVEQVSGVECRACTLIEELSNTEEHVDMLEGAVSTLLARAKRKGANLSDELERVRHLRDDLASAQTRLCELRAVGLDEDARIDALLEQREDLGNSTCSLATAKVHRCEALKCLMLTRMPAVLCIHVQRRYYDAYSNRMLKTMQQVVFPEILNMAPYTAYVGDGTPESRWNMQRQQQAPPSCPGKSPMLYRLMSAIEHRGSAFQGHYVCYRREPTSGHWLYISDDTVRSASWSEVRSCQAYMLFYEAM